MNSRERVIAALELRKPDRVPVFPQIGDHAGIVAGLTYDVMYRDAYRAADAHLMALARYGYDVVTIQVEPSWPVAEACGAQVTYPPDKNPWITRHAIEEKGDLDCLKPPDFTATQSSRVMIEGTGLLAQRADAPVAAFMAGPLTFSLQLMPYTKLIVAIEKDKAFVKRLLRRATEIIHAYGVALREAGASIFVICEHDVQLVSPQDFKELSINYLPPLLNIFPHSMLHLCGKVTPHLKQNADALKELKKLNMISIGPDVNLAEMKALFAGTIGIAGNIDHLHLLPHGTPQEVAETCRLAIELGKPGGGYMLSPGCEITGDTPPQNIQAFVQAAAKYGVYA